MLKWDNDSPVTFRPGKTLHDYEKRFRYEDEGYLMNGKKFKWADIEEPQINMWQLINYPWMLCGCCEKGEKL